MSNKSKEAGACNEDTQRPAQHQDQQPGIESEMTPQPISLQPNIKGAGRLQGRVAIISGGDSGIGRATAFAFAREGADLMIIYLDEHSDATATADQVRAMGRRCELFSTDIGTEKNCIEAVQSAIASFGKIDILVNNSAEQHPQKSIQDISEDQLEKTFRTNIFSMFFLTKAALPHLKKSSHPAIINTASVTAYRGSPGLIDYSSTKGAIVSFTRSLSQQLAEDGIRVNAVAPGPIWTPLIPATFPSEKVQKFGSDVPMGRAGQPWECGECFVFLASSDSSYMTGQTLHPNGGEIING